MADMTLSSLLGLTPQQHTQKKHKLHHEHRSLDMESQENSPQEDSINSTAQLVRDFPDLAPGLQKPAEPDKFVPYSTMHEQTDEMEKPDSASDSFSRDSASNAKDSSSGSYDDDSSDTYSSSPQRHHHRHTSHVEQDDA